jgi:hypothetical protein
MSSSFTLELDISPPANPVLLINGGIISVGSRLITASLFSADYNAGSNDVAQMLLWGDVDPTANPNIQPLQASSAWQLYYPSFPVTLSTGTGTKTIYAQIRDDVHNTTAAISATVIYDVTIPEVTITRGVVSARISTVALFNEADFTWQSSVAYTAYEVRVVANLASPRSSGVIIPTTGGSINTSGGSGVANVDKLTTIYGVDLATASPGDSKKLIKVFTQNASNVWSP